MKALFFLVRMRFHDLVRNRSSAAFFFVFPIVLFVVTGGIFSNGHPFERRSVVVVGDETSSKAHALLGVLASQPEVRVERATSRESALGRLRAHVASAVVVLGGDGDVEEVLLSDREGLFGRGLVAVMHTDARTRTVRASRFGYVHYLFPGMLTFSVLLSGLFGMGHVMALYRQNRFLKKLATTPLPKSTFVLAQILARTALVVVQVAILLVAAVLTFDVPLDLAASAWLIAIATVGHIAFMGVGFVLACVIQSDEVIIDVISAINMPVVLLSELFFPLTELPRVMAVVGEVLPTTTMVRLTRLVVLEGAADQSALLAGTLVLVAWSLGTFALSLAVFRWHDA